MLLLLVVTYEEPAKHVCDHPSVIVTTVPGSSTIQECLICPIYTLATVSNLLPRLKKNMAAATRKSMSDFKQHLSENDYVLIPSDIFTQILDDNYKTQEHLLNGHRQMVETQRSTNEALTKIAAALEGLGAASQEHSINQLDKMDKIADTIECMCASSQEHSTNLLAKMDNLISTISSTNNTVNATTPITTDDEFKTLTQRKCNKEQQIRRATELSEYYTELLARNPPFVQRKYRTKINRNTPEFEKKIHSDNTVQKVKQEIHLFQERVKNWTVEVQTLQGQIDGVLRSVSEIQANKFNKMLSDETERQQNEWSDKFALLKRTVSRDIDSGASQYLLKYADKKDSEDEDERQSQPKNGFGRDNQHKGKGRGVKKPGRGGANNNWEHNHNKTNNHHNKNQYYGNNNRSNQQNWEM